MTMKVESTEFVGGRRVRKIDSFSNIDVYETIDDNFELLHFFVHTKSKEVARVMRVEVASQDVCACVDEVKFLSSDEYSR